MRSWLLDTNVLLRMQDEQADCCEEVTKAVAGLIENSAVYVTPQVLIEFWCAGTRPVDVNGLGWDAGTVSARARDIKNRFELLEDCPAVFTNWLALVERHERKGKQVHDARLVAVMKAHGVENLLTFNGDDFAAYDEIKAVHPRDVEGS
jgi:predicted nucleic acid-binding protein